MKYQIGISMCGKHGKKVTAMKSILAGVRCLKSFSQKGEGMPAEIELRILKLSVLAMEITIVYIIEIRGNVAFAEE